MTHQQWIGCPAEEQYLKTNRKEGKVEKKRVMAKDRSKFKKTDKAKYLKGIEREKAEKLGKQDWLEGRVLSILPQGVKVECAGEMINCSLKGLLKKEKTDAKNLVTVGDFVLFEKTAPSEGVIGHIKERRSVLSRADNLSRRKEQMIAANIDQVIITASVVAPTLKAALIDRYIIAARKGGMHPLIVINKIDLLDFEEGESSAALFEERELYEETVKAYAAAGIPLIALSTKDGRGLEELKLAMRDKTSVFSGQSGVGKSSLINTMTGLDLRVGQTVEKTKKGAHTTTTAQLVPLPFGGWCIDTPGIKSFGVWSLDSSELEGYFPEIQAIGLDCKFSDCTHFHEEACAVQDALEAGRLSIIRYTSYQVLREGLDEEHVRR